MNDKQVVHVSSGDAASGHSITLAQTRMKRWHDRGVSVHPPVDGHPTDKLCPLCSIKVGQRVRLIRCTDKYTKLEPGTEGTVGFIDGMGTIHVDWDDGHRLGLLPDADEWEVTK